MSGGDGDCPVQLMTLHKAKGLEFERVFIPRLNGLTRGDSGDLLLWDEHSNQSGRRSFLLAANDRSEKTQPTLYNYLKHQRDLKTRHEATRLLYVGTTRAIRCLHLSAGVNWDESNDCAKAPAASALLSAIWPVFSAAMKVHDAQSLRVDTQPTARPLQRLVPASLPSPCAEFSNLLPADNFPEQADNHLERSVGVVVHLAFEELSKLPELPLVVTDVDKARWQHALQREGVPGAKLEQAESIVLEAAGNALAPGGPGRWILDANHRDARSEWALTMVEGGQIRDIVIDRSFVDRATGLRWIVDYKTSRPLAGESVDVFAAREAAHYRDQLADYRAALRPLGAEPIRCALYFTALSLLHEVEERELEGGVL